MAAPRFTIRSLDAWDRPVTEYRGSAAMFRATWDDTVKLLLDEVELLDGRMIVMRVSADPSDIRQDGMLRARAQVGFPGVKVSFDSRFGPLTYATDAYERYAGGKLASWQANVRAIALGLTALRAVDRYGITKTGEQYRGWTAIAAKPMEDTLTFDSARMVFADALGVQTYVIADDLRTKEGIGRVYKLAAKKHHPDVIGGDGSVMRLITKARDVLLAAAR